jgi:zinc/manganese transport system substrate-binding protein
MALLVAPLATGPGTVRAAAESGQPLATVVVTTEILGAIVDQLVGDAGEVVVVMPGGANPHTFEPSARDAELIFGADVLVSNGLELEEGLIPLLEAASATAVWFQAADHVELHDLEAADQDEATPDVDAAEADHGAEDPHIWTDPLLMRDVVLALVPVLAEAGLELGANGERLAAGLEDLDAEVREILSVVPEGSRRLVTGHRSLGYFAARYGFEQIGTVIPGLSTGGEPSARELARLISDIRESGVPAVFAEVGTPQSVARAVAEDAGAELVSLSTSRLPDDGTYEGFMRELAATVAMALAP